MINDYLNNARKKDVLTKFLSQEEQKQLGKSKHVLSEVGTERKRAYVFNNEITDVDFKISVLEVSYNNKFYSLTHSQTLGALMGLGITRDCIGDILIFDKIYIIVISEMTSFLLNNLITIDRASVVVKLVDNEVIKSLEVDNYVDENIVVSSLRLDVIVCAITNFSREQAKEYIYLKNVKVNGIIKTDINQLIKIDDLISIHRFGRTILKEIIRKTKKDKYVLLIKRTK
jgi:RNA-binding protein YlmH